MVLEALHVRWHGLLLGRWACVLLALLLLLCLHMLPFVPWPRVLLVHSALAVPGLCERLVMLVVLLQRLRHLIVVQQPQQQEAGPVRRRGCGW